MSDAKPSNDSIGFVWYSVKQAEIGGIFLYKTKEGVEIEGTLLTKTTEHQCKFDDLALVGEAVECLGKIKEGETDKFRGNPTPQKIKGLTDIYYRQVAREARQNDPMRWN